MCGYLITKKKNQAPREHLSSLVLLWLRLQPTFVLMYKSFMGDTMEGDYSSEQAFRLYMSTFMEELNGVRS